MNTINMLFSELLKEMTNVITKTVAEVMNEKNEQIARLTFDMYIRPVQESTLLKKVDVAKRLNVSPSTVTQLIDSNALKSTADGRVSEFHLWQYITNDGKNLS